MDFGIKTAAPTFPPLFHGQQVTGPADPMAKASALAMLGCDAGLVVHNLTLDRLRAAVVFAPEVPLTGAMAAMIACGIGFQNALGALAPPEVAVHLAWDGGLRVNGARCGQLRAAAAVADPQAVPDWLIVGLDVPLAPPPGTVPGQDPDHTYLSEEGCVEIDSVTLLEAWIRHSLVWINRMEEDGLRPLHGEWRGLAHGLGETVTLDLNGASRSGTFVGIDEAFGMLLRIGDDTQLIPLTALLETAP